jgi:hypothetical protein
MSSLLEVRPSTVCSGLGVFLKKNPVPEGYILGRYEGTILNIKDDRHLTREQNAYVLNIQGTYIDATDTIWGKFNHSRKKANCQVQTDGTIVTTRNINIGEELLWNYGMRYWCFQILELDYDRDLNDEDKQIWTKYYRLMDAVNLYELSLAQMLWVYDNEPSLRLTIFAFETVFEILRLEGKT